MQENQNSPQQYYDEDEINLLDLLIILAKYKKLIIGGTLIPGFIMAMFSFFMTPVYQAESRIYIPQSTNFSSQILNQFSPMANMTGIAKISSNDLYIEIIRSRPMCDRIIDRFDLMQAYKIDSRERVRKALLGRIQVRNDMKSGVILVGIQDDDPKKSADLTNAMVEEFRNLNKDIAVTEASKRCLFFEEQLKDAKNTLTESEEAMKDFQEKTGAIKIDAQAQAVIGSIAELRAQIAAKEVEIKVMQTYSTPQNPEIRMLVTELTGLHSQMQKMESKNSDDCVIVPTGNLPSTSTEYLRLMRELKFNETLYELLVSQYQAAKLDEARDAMTLQVIEKAEPPLIRIKPKRKKLVIMTTALGFIFSMILVFILHYSVKVLQDPKSKDRIDLLKQYLAFKH